MKVTDSNVIRFHLQVLHGITVRNSDRKKERLFVGGPKIFGVPLENLPRRYLPEFGLVPWWVRAAGSVNLWGKVFDMSFFPQLFGGCLLIFAGPCWDSGPVPQTRLSSSHKDPQGKVLLLLISSLPEE